MALTTADRKLLWARSGGFCAVCKGLLTEDATDFDPAVVTGMEAHIVSAKRGGPRYRPLEPSEMDDPKNLILLCPTHHAVVDKQDSQYSESQLRQIKRKHERWVKTGAATAQRRARIVRENVQLVIDEIAEARRTMIEALDDGWVFWDQELKWDEWERVRPELAPEKGVHAAYNATRAAWEAIQRVEIARLGRRGSGYNPYEIKSWESRWVQAALDRADEAETQLIRFLGNYNPESH